MLCTVVAVLLCLAGGLQIIYLLAGFESLRRKKKFLANGFPEIIPVSVIICARNEAANLEQRLPFILAQRYPSFEVIVADDGSDDGTEAAVKTLQKRFANLIFRKINVSEKAFRGKKGALQIAVTEAAHEVLLFTDADCIPASDLWIQNMIKALSPEKEIVVGYGPYEKASGFLNAFIRAETLLSFSQLKAFFRYGIVYMAVGRNLCVRKQTFLRASRHPLWTKTLSGDDDMLMRICATRQNTALAHEGETKMYSPAKSGWKAYRHQKQRHLSTGKYYRWPVKILLAGLSGTQTLCWLLFPFALACLWGGINPVLLTALGIFGLRTVLFYAFLRWQSQLEKESFPPFFLLLFDVAWACYPIFFAPYILWKNKDQWT